MAGNDLLGPDVLAEQLKNKSDNELARDMWLPENNQLHLMAKAEMTCRATLVTLRNSRYMLWSVIVATIAAVASAFSAYLSYVSVHH